MALKPKQIIDDRYEIIQQIGQGGMGTVWKARHVNLGDDVVIKVPHDYSNPEIARRFSREAENMRKFSLENPHILGIDDVGSVGEMPWYATRYLSGGSLSDRVLARDVNGKVQWDNGTFDWLLKIASALDFLHRNKTCHRDVKPDNIMFSGQGNPYLVDFGIVKSGNASTTMITDAGKIIGTWAYLAPELMDDQPFTGQADQYALGVALYETISGDRPFGGTTPVAVYKSILKGHRKLTELSAGIPTGASAAVDRALTQEPADRFETCEKFANTFMTGLNDNVVEPPVVPDKDSADDDATRELDLERYREQLRDQGNVEKGGPKEKLFSPPRVQPKRPGKATQPSSGFSKSVWMAIVALLLASVAGGGLFVRGVFYGSGDVDGSGDKLASSATAAASDLPDNKPTAVRPGSLGGTSDTPEPVTCLLYTSPSPRD